jgi:hypothetical protein
LIAEIRIGAGVVDVRRIEERVEEVASRVGAVAAAKLQQPVDAERPAWPGLVREMHARESRLSRG